MYKSLMFSIAALGLCAAQSASAADFLIQIEEGAFYPETTYLTAGDTVTFINVNETSAKVVSSDASWDSGDLVFNGSYLLIIAEDTDLSFARASDASIAGSLSFDLAPLGESDGVLLDSIDENTGEASN